jgi:hypothetical protein
MQLTRKAVARKLAAYLHYEISFDELVTWANVAMMEADFEEAYSPAAAVFPAGAQGPPADPPLSHPEQHVQTVQHRALPGSRARRRGCRGALGAWEEPQRGGEKFLVAPVSLWYHALYS